jgi:hypothetical protein
LFCFFSTSSSDNALGGIALAKVADEEKGHDDIQGRYAAEIHSSISQW